MRALVITMSLVLVFVVGTISVLAEVLLGATLYPWLTVGVAAIGAAVAWAGRRRFESRVVSVAGISLVIGIVVLRFCSLNPVKPFRGFYRSLKPGMTESLVMAELKDWFPEGGRFARPDVGRLAGGTLTFTLDRRNANYDSEIVQALFDHGRLVDSFYLID